MKTFCAVLFLIILCSCGGNVLAPSGKIVSVEKLNDTDPNIIIMKFGEVTPYARIFGEYNYVFSYNRLFWIIVNQKIPDVDARCEQFVNNLKSGDPSILHKSLFSWFGDNPSDQLPQRFEVAIGKKIPVDLAQAIIKAFGNINGYPMHISIMHKDEKFGKTQKLYVGGYETKNGAIITPEKFQALLRHGLTMDEFITIVEKGT